MSSKDGDDERSDEASGEHTEVESGPAACGADSGATGAASRAEESKAAVDAAGESGEAGKAEGDGDKRSDAAEGGKHAEGDEAEDLIGIEALDNVTLSQHCFFPRPNMSDELDVWPVTTGDGSITLHCHYFRPQRSRSAVTLVYFHGNGELVSECGAGGRGVEGHPDFADLIEEWQMNTLFVEYRGYGASGGAPTVNSLLADAEAVFAALALPAQQVVLMGRSLGSIPAIHLASCHEDIGGLVVESAIASPQSFILDRLLSAESDDGRAVDIAAVVDELQARFNHKDKLQRYKGRLLVLHTLDDALLPVHGASQLFGWATGCDEEALPETEWGRYIASGERLYDPKNAPPLGETVTWTHTRGEGSSKKRLVLFEVGGHQYIFDMNWKIYRDELLAFMTDCGWAPASRCAIM
eukprot:PLAT5918.1.p1 GENE.PLAT5918.1~~PLAT5918.1.p1  ORF type:complete len:421 (+),score=176.53 PLAT5918.1:32-1264(+)